jgi:excisionase family DNA binding protein
MESLSVPQVAERLGCSGPTVRALLAAEELAGVRATRGTRNFWRVDGNEVARYLSEHGRFPSRRPSMDTREIQEQLDDLASRVDVLESKGPSTDIDGLRAEVVALRDALHLQRQVTALMREADGARAAVVTLLVDAVKASETADEKRRQVIAITDSIAGALSLPRSPGEL